MVSKLTQMTISDLLVYAVWTVLIVGKALGFTSESDGYSFAVLISMFFAALQLAINPGERWQVVAFILAYCLGVLAWFYSGDNSLLLAVVMLSLFKTVNVRSLCTYTLLVCVPIVVARMLLAVTGLADMQPSYYFERDQYRYGLGFTSPNSAQSVLAFLVSVATVSGLSKRKKRVVVILLLAFSLYIYQYTGCRTALIVEMLVGIYFFLPARFRGCERVMSGLVLAVPVVAVLLACIYPLWAGRFSLGTFGSRFLTAYQLISSGSLAPFGSATSPTDLGYISLVAKGGLAPLVVLVVINWRAARYFAQNEMKDELMVMLAYAVYGVMEAFCTTVTLNPVFLLLPIYIYRNRSCVPVRVGSRHCSLKSENEPSNASAGHIISRAKVTR